MELDWMKCNESIWCELNSIDLNHKNLKRVGGVYIIWYEIPERQIVRVGYGTIRDELQGERNDHAVQAFSKYNLKATWAEVPLLSRKGIYCYLANQLSPKISDYIPETSEIDVNLPWD